MATKWLVAKYMPDLRRREPMNIGVILVDADGQAWVRFKGMRADGTVDGRAARWAHSPENYRAHIDYWRHLITRPLTDEVIERAIRPLGDENYLLEYGGERLAAAHERIDPGVMLDRLYAELVEETPDRASLSVSQLSDAALHQAHLPAEALHRQFRLEFEFAGVRDAVTFDYRFDNGAIHLMRNVSLSFPDQRSWDSVHAALWGYERAEQNPVERDRAQRYISFVKPREQDAELDEQLEVLRSQGTVVDVSEPDRAAEHLAGLVAGAH